MKLVAYLFRLFLPLFIGAMLIFTFVLELVDLMMNIWKYIYNSVPPSVIARIQMLYLPKSLTWALPLSILFASCYMLSMLYSRNELTALFASGVSLLRFTSPLIVFATVLSVCFFFFQDKVVVPFNGEYETIKNEALGQKENLNNDHIVILSNMGQVIYKADFYDDSLQRLHNLYLILRNEDRSLKCIIKTDYASWNKEEGHWFLSNGVQYDYDGNNLIAGTVKTAAEAVLVEPPETFQNNTISVEQATVKEAKAYVEHLKNTGLPFSEALSQYYNKFSFPFVMLIVVFLSIGISGKSERNVFVISLTLSVGAAVLFYVTQMVTMLMAKFGNVSPIVGAWFPVFIFIILSGVLLKFTRT